jgi:hypothetical protein
MRFGPAAFAAEALWLGVTAHPSAEWVARQLTRPPARLSGCDPLACLDHVVILTRSISGIFSTLTKHIIYQAYYNESRTRLSLREDAPISA